MRRLLLISTAILGCSFTLPASVDRDLLALVPAAAQSVAAIDVSRAQGSAFGQFALTHIDQNDDKFNQFIEQTGFDPRRDLQQIVFASTGPKSSDEDTNFVILARGSFDISRIESTAKARGSVTRPYHAWNLLLLKNGNRHATALVFPQADVAVFGDLATIKTILDNSTAPSSLDVALAEQIGQVGPVNDAWFASLSGGKMFAPHINADQTPDHAPSAAQTKALQSILETSGGIRFGTNVDISLNSLTRSPQDATSLSDVIRMGTSMFQMQRNKDPNAAIVASAFDKMTLEASGSRVHLALSLPEKDLEQLAAKAH